MQPKFLQTPRGRIAALMVTLVILVVAAGLAYILSRPTEADFEKAQSAQIGETTEARKAIVPAVNSYLKAFKAAYNETNSAQKASQKVEPEKKALVQAIDAATHAITQLDKNKIAADGDIGPAVKQQASDYKAEVAYYASLVEDYPVYTTLFAKDATGCARLFIGEADGLSDRKSKLDEAAKQCLGSLQELKSSSNVTYADYAMKVERRVKRLQTDAAATVKAEQKLKEYEKRAADYQRQYDEAKARNAPDSEIFKLADELKSFNAEINENKASFDFAAKSYLATVKELPGLYASVYDTEVPAKQKYYDQLVNYRTSVLTTLVNGRIKT